MNSMLNELAKNVAGAHDLESLTRPILGLLEAVTGLESTYLTNIDEAGGVQQIVYSLNTRNLNIPEGLSVPWRDTLCKRALEEGRPYTDDVATAWGDSQAARELGIQTYISQPVHTLDGTLYGTLCAASASKISVDSVALNVLNLFARIIAQQIERERLLETLRKSNADLISRAMTDPLTGIANRRAVVDELNRMLARTQRNSGHVTLAFIDLDGFKWINDQYGHDVGDRFLIHIAERLSECIRIGDMVGRLGGDEFVVLSSGNGNGNESLCSRLENATRGEFKYLDLSINYPGASVGVVESFDGETSESIIVRADKKMYEIKKIRKGQ